MDSLMDLATDNPARVGAQVGPARLVFLLGAPRSGTTWLAKLFDSHPDVLYRNEPDSILEEPRLPPICKLAAIDQYRDVAGDYIDRLLRTHTLKSSGSLPVFGKDFLLPLAHPLRRSLIYALHLASTLPAAKEVADRLPIPDLLRRDAKPTMVIKSVKSVGLARLFLEAAPDSRMVFIARHPCGQVGSVMRGLATGVFNPPDWDEVLMTVRAKELGLTAAYFASLEPVEQWAWHWALLNQKAYDELSDMARVRFVSYEDMVADPESHFREMFAFCGLGWTAQTAAFLDESTTYTGKSSYYGVKRDSVNAAQKWRTEVPAETQQRIIAIARKVPVGRLLTDAAYAG
jgi:hypothetical protein